MLDLSPDPREKRTTGKGNDDCVAEEEDEKYRIVLKCSLSLESEEKK